LEEDGEVASGQLFDTDGFLLMSFLRRVPGAKGTQKAVDQAVAA
jgi:hypothetical protein